MCSIKFQMLLKKNIKLKTKVSKIRTCWNSWTLVARVGRWTLDSGLWTLDSLDTVLACFRTDSEPNFCFCLIKLSKILWVRISKDLMVTLVL